MSLNILDRIQSKQRALAKLRPLPKVALQRLKSELAVEWTYNSNAIEGNTLTLQETRLVLEHGITIKGRSLREHFEAKNHEKAIYLVEELAQPRYTLNEEDIFRLHALVLQNIESEHAGRYRNGQVRIVGANFIPPNFLKVSSLMKELLTSTNDNRERLGHIELVARFHHRFVWIHPFFDGNGRTARLLMNLLFLKFGYPPAIILKNDRERYYRALNEANKGEHQPFLLLIAQSIERSLDLHLECTGALGSDDYVPLSILAKKFPYSQEYLSLLARQGKIDAHKKARNWLATERSIADYLKTLPTSSTKKGRPPKSDR